MSDAVFLLYRFTSCLYTLSARLSIHPLYHFAVTLPSGET